MKETLERELKLRTGEGFALPPLGGDELEPRVFVSSYYDTPDLRLQRAGATLRHRVETPAAQRAGGRPIERELARRAAARAGFGEAWSRLDGAGRKASKA